MLFGLVILVSQPVSKSMSNCIRHGTGFNKDTCKVMFALKTVLTEDSERNK